MPVLIFEKKGNESHTNRWSIGRFWSRRLLIPGLELHKMRFVSKE
jgi:hypothetical protein